MTSRRHTLPVKNTAGAPGTHELVFYDWGDINAPRTAICVHGLTRNAHDFDRLAEGLVNQGRRVLALNMAGRGESAWLADPAGYNYASYVADCLAIMDNFHLRNVEWIGTSMGGIIGMMLAAGNPGRIKKLVLNDIGIHLSREALSRIFTYISTMPKQFATRAQAEFYLAEIFAPFKLGGTPYWEAFVDSSFLLNTDGSLRYACDPAIAEPIRATTKNFTEVQDVNLADFWEKITIPTLILRGAESDILSPETVRAMRASNMRADSITIEAVGHAPPLMAPEQIRLVTEWLKGDTTSIMASGL
jgi:pimeloyl-ACP methyl ester carboxylesterase